MANLIYDSFMLDLESGAINPSTDILYMMLVSAGYSPNKKTNTRRSNVTNEITGTNYVSGGLQIIQTVTLTTASDVCDITFASLTFINVTFVGAVAGVIYKHRGGAASADNLYAYTDFGGAFSPSGENFIYTASAPLRLSNP